MKNTADALSSIEGLLKSEKYSDMTIRCQQTEFKVHRAIVCTRSPVLAAAIDGNFKEATSREIDLSADEHSVIKAMVQYLYMSDYDDSDNEFNSTKSLKSLVDPTLGESSSLVTPAAAEADGGLSRSFGKKAKKLGKTTFLEPINNTKTKISPDLQRSKLVFNVKVYIAGDTYNIPGLKKLAKEKFEEVVKVHWNCAEFSEATDLLWENTVDTDRSLRDVVLESAKTNIKALLDRGDFVELMQSRGNLCVEVLKGILDPTAAQKGMSVQCKSCSRCRSCGSSAIDYCSFCGYSS